MKNKPVFLWWAHKKFWDIIANDPAMNKCEAIEKLLKMHPSIESIPMCNCFACEAQKYYGDCVTIRCPLLWSYGRQDVALAENYGCERVHNGNRDSLYGQYLRARKDNCYGLISAYAKKIRDLPLRENARELYDVKESPND